MLTSRFISSKSSMISRIAAQQHRNLACAPAERIRCVIEEYRLKNYSREIPSRFKKELIQSVNCDNREIVEVECLNRMLVNIGRSDQVLSEEELLMILKEAGVNSTTSRCISTATVLELV